MSAWIVTKEHINYLLHSMMYKPGSFPFSFYFNGKQTVVTSMNASKIGQILWEENHKSINHRYNLDDKTPKYKFTQFMLNAIDPVVAFKQIDCYDYQSCEHPGWEKSKAKVICEALRSYLIGRLEGYDDAPWGIRAIVLVDTEDLSPA